MKTIKSILFLISISYGICAQNNLPVAYTLAMCKVSNNCEGIKNEDIEAQLQALISNVLTNSGRFTTQSLRSLVVADDQIDRLKDAHYLSSEIVRQDSRAASQIVIYGQVTSLSCEPKDTKNEQTGVVTRTYEVDLEYVINYLIVESAVIPLSRSFRCDGCEGKTPRLAVQAAINSTKGTLYNWVKEFSIPIQAVLADVKKNDAKSRYDIVVKTGTLQGFKIGETSLDLKYKEKIGSNTLFRSIGKMTVTEVQSELTVGYMPYATYEKEASKVNISKPLDILWRENNQSILVNNIKVDPTKVSSPKSFFNAFVGFFHGRVSNSNLYKSNNFGEGTGGLELGASYSYSFIDIEAFYLTTRVDSQRLKIPLAANDTARFTGFSAALSINPFKSARFSPFVGIGYQIYTLKTYKNEYNISGAYWKAGFDFAIKRTLYSEIFLRGEYIQSFLKKEDIAQGAAVKVGFRLRPSILF